MSGPRFTASLSRAGVNTAGVLYWQLRAGATQRLYIVELGISVNTPSSNAPNFRIARALTSLGTASTTAIGVSYDPTDASPSGTFESAWSVAPTLSTIYARQMGLAVTAGGGFIWTFYDSPFILSATNALQISNGNNTGGTLGNFSAYVVWDE